MFRKFLNRGPVSVALSVVLSMFFVVAVVEGATTISTNILTGGTLGVTGLSSLGQASSTMLSAGTAYFGTTATSTFGSAGALTLVGALSGTSGSFSTTLGVTGLATLSGGATTTSLRLLSGDILTNASASTTVVSGSLTVGDGTASAPSLTVTNGASATSTVTVGCVVTTATSSATKVKLIFNTTGTSTLINGNTVAGFVLWAYGSTCN